MARHLAAQITQIEHSVDQHRIHALENTSKKLKEWNPTDLFKQVWKMLLLF